jgi:hypothetical protein
MDKKLLTSRDCFQPNSDLPVIVDDNDGSILNIDNTKFYKNIFATDDPLNQSPKSIANNSLFPSSDSRTVFRFDSDSTDIYPLRNPAQSSTILSQPSIALTNESSISSIYFDEPDDEPVDKYIENLSDIPQEVFLTSRSGLDTEEQDQSQLQKTLFNFSINPLLPIDQQHLGVFSTIIATRLVSSGDGAVSSAPFDEKEPHSYFSSIDPFNKINQDISDATMLSEIHQKPIKRRRLEYCQSTDLEYCQPTDDDYKPSIIFLKKNIRHRDQDAEHEFLKIDDDDKLLDLIKNYPIRRFREDEDLDLREFKLDFNLFYRRCTSEKTVPPFAGEELKLDDVKPRLFKNSFFGLLAIIIINELMIKSFDENELVNTNAFLTNYNLSDVCRKRNFKELEIESAIFDNFKKVICSFQKFYPKKILIHNFREKQFMEEDLEKLELKDICRKAIFSIKTAIESRLSFFQTRPLKLDRLDLLYLKELTEFSLKTYEKLNQKPSTEILLMPSGKKIDLDGPARRGL